MSQQNFYKINSPQVISETIDGETIIINLDSGNYYSLNQTGGIIWNGIREGMTSDQVLSHLGQNYEVEAKTLETSFQGFLAELSKEELIVGAEPSIPPTATSVDEDKPITKSAFLAPQIQKYDDMQDLLLIDPIHDVDETGWPKTNEKVS